MAQESKLPRTNQTILIGAGVVFVVGVIAVIIISFTFPFGDDFLSALFPKPDSEASGRVELRFNPSSVSAAPNDTFVTDIVVDPNGEQVIATDIVVLFDTDKLTLDTVDPNQSQPLTTFLPTNLSTAVNEANTTGRLVFGAIAFDGNGTTNGITTDTTLATLHFSTTSVQGTHAIRFEFTSGERNDSNIVGISSENDLLEFTQNASVSVQPAPTNTPVPTSTPVPTNTPIPPTSTPIPPTATPVPTATNTPVPTPTNTPVPPTSTPVPPTSTPPPTATSIPPTNTPVPPTATTAPPEQISFSTSLSLQGRRSGDLERSVRVKVEGTSIDQTVQMDAQGQLNVTLPQSLSSGTYSVQIKPDYYLQQSKTVTFQAGSNTIDFADVTFFAGDLDNSGEVNTIDYVKIASAFNSSDQIADIDGSGEVNVIDISYLLQNWNKVDQ